jgi:pimeloyl-ACP methyl ester carboxylesterase
MASMSDPSIWKDDVIRVPVLALYADHSRLANQEYLKQIYPALEYAEIPGTGHFLMLEKPEEFNRLLLGFLEKHHL